MRRLLYHPALLHRYVDCAVGAACTASGGVAHAAQTVSLAHTHNSILLRDSVHQATSQVQRCSRDFGGSPERPCLAQGDFCPPGKGCNRAGPSSRDEAGVLQPLLHRTQKRWWSSTNPVPASLELSFAQAPVQDADTQAHDQMHPAPGLVCSNRPEGRLLSCFDSSTTQTVPTVCVQGSGMAVQGSPIRALPVSLCFHEGCRRRPYPVTGSGRQDPQLPRRLARPCPIQRAVVRSQGLGVSGRLGKKQALPCAENLFSRCGVRLGEYDGMPHGRACPSSAELPEFLQRQECGTTETVSEAPGAYAIHSCSHATRVASYETTSALATLPSPEVGTALRYTSSEHHSAVLPLPQPLDGPCLSTGHGAPRTSVPAYCCHNRCLQHGLGRYMQRIQALDGAPTALAHQLPRAVGSASSLMAVPATAVGQARASPHGQHCSCLVHQPVGRYTITPHHSSPTISSSGVTCSSSPCMLSTSRGSSIVRPTISHESPGEWRLHPETIRLIWSRFREAQVDLFASHESSHCQLYFFLTKGPLGTDTLAHSWPQALHKFVFPPVSLLAQTLCKFRKDEEQVLLVAPHWPTRTWFPELISLTTALPRCIPPLSGAWHHMAPASRSVEPPCVAPGRDVADLSGLPPAVVETITQARAPSTRQTYALKWSLFANWCSSRQEDPRRCMIGVVLSFLQESLKRRLSPSTLKVYVAAIAAHHDAVDGRSL